MDNQKHLVIQIKYTKDIRHHNRTKKAIEEAIKNLRWTMYLVVDGVFRQDVDIL